MKNADDLQQETLVARVPAEMKRRFVAQARRRKKKPSELLRLLVTQELGAGMDREGEMDEDGRADDTLMVRATVRMSSAVKNAVTKRAGEAGLKPARWMSALIQSNVTSPPVLLEEQTLAILAMNRELNAIGRNINQIAKNLNEHFHDVESVRLDLLTLLSADIREAKTMIHALVQASQRSWEVGGDG